MSITYEEALSTLEAMFGDPWTRETLDAVLRHEKGHMENTCDRILNHGSGSPQALLDKLANGDTENNAPSGAHLSMDEELARSLAQQEERRSTRGSSSGAAASAPAAVAAAPKKQRGTPTTLPKDFLRIPGYPHPSLAAEAAAENGTLADDETLARMLQDELFSQELARNPDFAHLARGRPSAANFPAVRRTSQQRAGSGGANPDDEGPKIIEKLSEMGDTARKRLAIFAAQFEQRMKNAQNNSRNGRRPNAFQNIFKGGAAGGGATSLSPTNSAAAERRGLLDDDDDDQDIIEFEMRKNK